MSFWVKSHFFYFSIWSCFRLVHYCFSGSFARFSTLAFKFFRYFFSGCFLFRYFFLGFYHCFINYKLYLPKFCFTGFYVKFRAYYLCFFAVIFFVGGGKSHLYCFQDFFFFYSFVFRQLL